MIPKDPLNAFTRHTHVALDGSGAGPLAGLTMAVKDVYDIAGHRDGQRQSGLAVRRTRRPRGLHRAYSGCSMPARAWSARRIPTSSPTV